MNDKKWIITGLVVFIAIILIPLWLNFGKAAPAPDLVLSANAKAAGSCILPKAEMKTEHMQLLHDWRHDVVREGKRMYRTPQGKVYNMSLSSGDKSCLGCHTNKAEFCDRCHNYASVRPYCWDCHHASKEKM